MTEQRAAIEARSLVAIHAGSAGPVQALRGLDLQIWSGELAAIVGPSGSGKSTLLRLLAGEARPTAGSLSVLGVSLDRATDAELRRHREGSVGVVEQHYRLALSPYLPIRETIELPLAVRGVAPRARRRRTEELLETLGLADRAEALPSELSGGEQQRVAVAAAIAIRPGLLLADEPTGELDAETGATLLGLIRDLVRREGTTCVVVTHDELVDRVADRVVHVRDGRAVAERSGGDARALSDSLGWTAPPLRIEPVAGNRGTARAAARPGATDTTDTTDPAVRFERVSRVFGSGGASVRALRDVSMAIPRGDLHVVTGPSGSGKSTALRLIAGLDRPTAGSVEVLGESVARLSRAEAASFRARRIGLAEQARGLVAFLTAAENVEEGLAIRGIEGGVARDQARDVLERVGVGRMADRRPDELSAGERTRVAIARALAARPELLLLDEPTATLDRSSAASVAELAAELGREVTVVAATHDRALIEAAASEVALARS